jgi:hypothetical protein
MGKLFHPGSPNSNDCKLVLYFTTFGSVLKVEVYFFCHVDTALHFHVLRVGICHLKSPNCSQVSHCVYSAKDPQANATC